MSLCSPPQNRGSLRNGGCASAQTLDLGGQQTGRTGPQTPIPAPGLQNNWRSKTGSLGGPGSTSGFGRREYVTLQRLLCTTAGASPGLLPISTKGASSPGGGRGSSGQVENITGRTGGERARENEFGGPTRRPRRPNQPAGSFRPATRPSYMLSYVRANKKAHVLPLACAACLLGRSPARPHHQAGHLGRFLCHPPPRRTCALR